MSRSIQKLEKLCIDRMTIVLLSDFSVAFTQHFSKLKFCVSKSIDKILNQKRGQC